MIGLSGALSLFLMRLQIDSFFIRQLPPQHAGSFRVDYEIGYWIAIVFFLVAGLSNMSRYIDQLKNTDVEAAGRRRSGE